jgi:DNA (cytosine-5)-methyltransferase 1
VNYSYYNENDPAAVAWLKELLKRKLITDGVVDDRSIELVRPEDLKGFTRMHLFAGIAGWDHSLTLAGWGDRPVMTLSCPCQPFSSAGKRGGTEDERHLFPVAFDLIRALMPPVLFGEQVSSKDGIAWYDHVKGDLNSVGYSVAAMDMPASAFGAPHIRQRLYFVGEKR